MHNQVVDELTKIGLRPKENIAFDREGILFRYQSELDKQGRKDSWVVFYPTKSGNGVCGAAGRWGKVDTTKFSSEGGNKDDGISKADTLATSVFKMESELDAAVPATDQHPYLLAKKVKAAPFLKCNSAGNLLIPLSSNKIVTGVSVINKSPEEDGSFSKWMIKGSKPRGSYFVIKGDKDTIYIAEGYATAYTAHEATGKTAVMAHSAGNLLSVARATRSANPDAHIVIVADNNPKTKDNPGRTKGIAAAREVGADIAIPNYDGDLNDAISKMDNRPLVLDILKGACKTEDLDMYGVPDEFSVTNEGVYKIVIKKTTEEIIPICETPVRVRGYTRDINGNNWGRDIEITTKDDKVKNIVLPAEALMNNAKDAVMALVNAGAIVIPGRERLLGEYLMRCNPKKKLRCSTELGWLDNTWKHYVQPKDIISAEAESIRFQPTHQNVQNPYSQHGTLKGWTDNVSMYAKGNPILMLAISQAFAAPLARVLGCESFGVHIFGEGSIGKSTSACVAASVWGMPTMDGYVQTWDNTPTALEETATVYNNNLLILDEVGDFRLKHQLGQVIFMLTGGQSRGRSTSSGGLRDKKTWNILFYSTGNAAISELLRNENVSDTRVHAGGQMVRRIEIPVMKGEMDIFKKIYNETTPDKFAVLLRKNTLDNYGVAGKKFLQRLIEDNTVVQKWKDYLQKGEEQRRNEVYEQDGGGQHMRVYSHFQLLSFAGELATEWGFTGWKKGEASADMLTLFQLWFSENNQQSSEKTEIVNHIISILRQEKASFITEGMENRKPNRIYGQYRYCVISTGQPLFTEQDKETFEMNSMDKQRDRVEWAYYITPTVFKREFCSNMSSKNVIEWLKQEGMYLTQKTLVFEGERQQRYHIIMDKKD